jgi:aminoglycoside phosphotransferase (APT) family kinase protein
LPDLRNQSNSEPPGLLSADTVVNYLQRRGLASTDDDVQAWTLGGGVSNIVIAAHTASRRVVVKQSLPQLRVADEWLAKRERALTEAAALRWAATLTPDTVPAVYDVDAGAYAITIAHAPADWHDWKQMLLKGDIDSAIAARLGEVLATWHGATGKAQAAASGFDDAEAFDQLRVDPYYRAIMARHPGLAPEIAGYVDRMQSTHRCIVHGDYSPKNVLVGADGLWVIDFEVAHLGDPAFDLAFMHNHLLLKAIHRPADIDVLEDCARAFWDAYRARVPAGFAGPTSYVLGHVGCLMLARVDGKSPAEYLSPQEQATARALSITLLEAPPMVLGEAWARLRMEIRK